MPHVHHLIWALAQEPSSLWAVSNRAGLLLTTPHSPGEPPSLRQGHLGFPGLLSPGPCICSLEGLSEKEGGGLSHRGSSGHSRRPILGSGFLWKVGGMPPNHIWTEVRKLPVYLAVMTPSPLTPPGALGVLGHPQGRQGGSSFVQRSHRLRCGDKPGSTAGCLAPAYKGRGGSCLMSH